MTVYNFGHTAEVVAIEHKGKSVLLTTRSHQGECKEYTRRKLATTLVAVAKK